MKNTQELIKQGLDYRNAISGALLATNNRFTQQLKKLQASTIMGGDWKTTANSGNPSLTATLRIQLVFLPRIADDMSRVLERNEAITEFFHKSYTGTDFNWDILSLTETTH